MGWIAWELKAINKMRKMIPLLLTDSETISENEAFESHELNTNTNVDRHKFVNGSSFMETEF